MFFVCIQIPFIVVLVGTSIQKKNLLVVFQEKPFFLGGVKNQTKIKIF